MHARLFRPVFGSAFALVLGCGTGSASNPGATSLAGRVEAVGAMASARAAHTATPLADGRVLIAGGCVRAGCEGRTASTEIFDPATETFVPGPDMAVGRASHAAAALPDGSVLVSGGWGPGGLEASAEVYDPSTGAFARTADMTVARGSHVAVPLADGRLLVIGGHDPEERVLASAEIFDPATGVSEPTGDLSRPRHKLAALALADGRVLVVGGSDADDFDGRYRSAEVWHPATGRFERVDDMASERFKLLAAVAPLPDGGAAIAGGADVVEAYDPGTGTFAVAEGTLGDAHSFASATPLPGGDVLVVGGYDDRIRPTARAWVYRP